MTKKRTAFLRTTKNFIQCKFFYVYFFCIFSWSCIAHAYPQSPTKLWPNLIQVGNFIQEKSINLKGRKINLAWISEIIPKLSNRDQQIDSLDASHCQIRDDNIYILIKILKKLPHIEKMNLSGNQLSHLGIAQLERILIKLPKLKQLDLSHNKIRDLSIGILLRIYQKWAPRLDLSLTGNPISHKEFFRLSLWKQKKQHPNILHLSHSKYDQYLDTLKSTLQQWPELTELNLSSNKLSDHKIHILISILTHLPQLKKLNLSGNRLGNDSLFRIASIQKYLPHLVEIDLSDNPINDESVSILKQIEKSPTQNLSIRFKNHNSSMKEKFSLALPIQKDNFTDPAGSIEQNSHPISEENIDLVEIDLVNVTLPDHLTHNESTSILTLMEKSSTQPLSIGLNEFKNHNHSMREEFFLALPTQKDNFTDPAGSVEQNSHLIPEENIDLVEIDLVNVTLPDHLTHNESTSILTLMEKSSTQPLSIGLNEFKNHNHSMREEFFLALRSQKENLSDSVDLSIHPILDENIDIFLNMVQTWPLLKKIDFSFNEIGQNNIHLLNRILKAVPQLKELNLSYTQMDDASLLDITDSLKTLTQLTTFDISNNQISSEGIDRLFSLFQNWNQPLRLSVMGNRETDKNEFKFEILGQKLYDSTQLSLSHLQSLTEENIDIFLNAAKTSPLLKKIDLSFNEINPSNIHFIEQILKAVPQLKELNFSHNQIDNLSLSALTDSLKTLTELIKLNISHNQMGPQGINMLLSLFQNWNHPFHVSIAGNQEMDKNGLEFDVLQQTLNNPVLLNLSRNAHILTKGVDILLYMPNTQTAWTHLKLSHNQIGNQDIPILQKALKHFSHLEHLDLSHNQVTNYGISLITNLIKKLPNLRQVDLSDNPIDNYGVRFIREMIQRSPQLIRLTLSVTDVKKQQELADLARDSHVLEVITTQDSTALSIRAKEDSPLE